MTNQSTKPCPACGGTKKLGRKEVVGIPDNLHGGVPAEVLNPHNVRITIWDCPDCDGDGSGYV